MMKRILLVLFTCLLTVSVWGSEQASSPDTSSNPSVKYIQRSMKAMEESTAANPAHIRVLFYGQSIVCQAWTKSVQKYLQEKYPTVQFTFQNNAIGGYTSERLYRTAESDLYPWYPDLLFFHVYGNMDKYEEIIRTTREKTSAEIIIWTSHLSATQDPKSMLEKRDSRSSAILALAEKYQCMAIDLNQKWCKLLLKNNWASTELLRDSVHMTPKGCEYYAQFIQEELVRLPGTTTVESASGTIQTIPLTDSRVTRNTDGTISVKFCGNRISAVNGSNAKRSAFATLLLDGKAPGSFKELWSNTRTSCCPKWMPSIFSVRFNVPLIKEEWTLTALPNSEKNGKKIYYRVTGSQTGFDGEGVSTEDFTSRSGRVVIPKNSFNTMFDYFKMQLPPDYKVTWKSEPLFADPYRPVKAGVPTVLIQNCTHGEHTLTLKPTGDVDIKEFIVNSPARKTETLAKVGTRPYELVWSGRNVDPIKAFLDFEQDEPWTATADEVDATFTRSQEQLIWGDYVYRLAFRAKPGQKIPEEDANGAVQRSTIRIRPPKAKAVPNSPFDVISVWIHGNHWRRGANTQQQIVTPYVEAVFLEPDGKEFVFPLEQVVWRDWFLVYKRFSDEQIARLNRPGVRFNGFNVRGGIQNRELVICFDNLALFKEEFKPLTFSQRARRGIEMFPGQDSGFNTGQGRLPFPTRNETILPDSNRPNAKNSAKKISDKLYELRYDGPDGTLVFEYRPNVGDWSDFSCRWNNLPAFTPLTTGGVRVLAESDKKIVPVQRRELRSIQLDGDTLKTTWNYVAGTTQTEVKYHFRLVGKSLLLDTFSTGGKVDEITFGKVTAVHDVASILIPYLSCGGWKKIRPAILTVTPGTNKTNTPDNVDSLFVFGSPDWYRSNASILFARYDATATSGVFHGGVNYRPKTDGKRNDVFERFVVTVSPTFADVLPTIANPVSPYKHIAGKKLWRGHGANNRDEDKLIWKKVWRYGMREVVITDHETFFRDGGDSFTFRTRSAPGKGGDAATLDYSKYIREELGFLYGPYNNFTDFATLNEFWSPDMVSRKSDKSLQSAWVRCYAPKPIRGLEYCERLTPIIKEKFKVNTAYCDVHTAVTPWSRTDYDARVPGAGTFAATFYAFGEIMLLQKKGWNGPVYSEGPNHFMYSGLTDGNYAQDNTYRFMDNPWLVDFDLLKIHDLECNFGMGHLGMFSPAVKKRDKVYQLPHYEGDTPADLDRFIDRFLSATLAFGHTGFLILDWCFEPGKAFGLAYGPQGKLVFEQGLPIAMRSYYMNQQIASRYTQASVDSIRYCDASGTQLSTSDAIRCGALARNQLVIQYKDGTTVCVNGHNTEILKTMVAGRKIELPPNGYMAWTSKQDILVESKLQNGKRYDYCQSPAYIYLDTRGADLTLPQAKGTGIAVCRILKDGKYEIIPLSRSKIGFALDVQQAIALDFNGKELGKAQLVRDGKYTFVTPVPGAISYILE